MDEHARNRVIVENILDALLVHDFQGRILDVNEHTSSLTGFSREELLALNLRDLGDAPAVSAAVKMMLDDGTLLIKANLRTKDGILVLDDEGRLGYANPATCEMSGWEEAELIGRHFLQLVPPDQHKDARQRWQDLNAGIVHPFELDTAGKDGSRRNLLVSARGIITDGQRKFPMMLKDITERKKAEEELGWAGARLRQFEGILNRSPAIVFRCKPPEGGRVEFVSANVSQLGYTEGDFLSGRVSWPDITHPDDVTARRIAQQALAQSEASFKALFEHTREGVINTGPDGVILAANPAAAVIMGMPGPAELIGQHPAVFVVDADQHAHSVDLLRRIGFLDDVELAVERQDGTRTHVLAGATVQRLPDGGGSNGSCWMPADANNAASATTCTMFWASN